MFGSGNDGDYVVNENEIDVTANQQLLENTTPIDRRQEGASNAPDVKLIRTDTNRRKSQLGQSSVGGLGNMQKSIAGFDIGVNKSVGQFYSSVRQKQQGE